MAETSLISWTDATFNPWIGCTKVAPECDNCYAERDNRFHKWNGGSWGLGAPRTITSEANWKKPFKWNALAAKGLMPDRTPIPAGQVRPRIFAASLADIFDKDAPWWPDNRRLPSGRLYDARDRQELPTAREVFFADVVGKTPHLDWLILTKRFEVAAQFFYEWWGEEPPPNVALIFSAGNQKAVDRALPILLHTDVAVRGISAEPLLGPIDMLAPGLNLSRLHWLIVGGESGPQARPTHPGWVRQLRDQAIGTGVAFHFKQWGEWASYTTGNVHADTLTQRPWIILDSDGRHLSDADDDTQAELMVRVGKHAAGRLLDGREWNEYPEVRS